ncbi:MAG: TIGR01777 family oxidoreductase [Anaerolineales bacterium]|jgi:hypothetical protein
MRIIISGGSGLIGRALTKELITDGHEVKIISRKPEKLNDLSSGVTAFAWKEKELIEHFEGADVVVNMVGASIAGDSPLNIRWTPKRKRQILESRVKGGKMITRAIQSVSNKPKMLVQQSAVGYYGPMEDELVDETFPLGDDFLSEVTRRWEESTKPVETLGVRRVITRTGLVFSPKGGIFPLLKLPFSLFMGGQIGSGQQYLSWIHIDDLVNIIRFLIDHEVAEGVFNATSPNPVKNIDFARALGKAMKRPAFVPVPSFVLKLVLGEASTLALDGQRVVPKRLLETGYIFRYKTLADAFVSLL